MTTVLLRDMHTYTHIHTHTQTHTHTHTHHQLVVCLPERRGILRIYTYIFVVIEDIFLTTVLWFGEDVRRTGFESWL